MPGTREPRFVLVSDLDHTMVQNEDLRHARLIKFNSVWSEYFADHSLLVFSTGRSPELFRELWSEAPLLTPDVLICSVGTEIFYRDKHDAAFKPDATWERHLDRDWNRSRVLQVAQTLPQFVPQVSSEQRNHKLSFHLHEALQESKQQLVQQLKEELQAAGLAAKVVYSGGVDVDILASGAGKGCALAFLLEEMKASNKSPLLGVQVNGDSGNDIELYQVPGVRGCVVANAHPELLQFYHQHAAELQIYLAQEPCSGGIVEALQHWKTLPTARTAPAATVAVPELLRSWLLRHVQQSPTSACTVSVPPYWSALLHASPGATVIPVGGQCVSGQWAASLSSTGAPAELAAVSTFVDLLSTREVSEGIWLLTYQTWSMLENGKRDMASGRQVSALLRVRPPGNHQHDELAPPFTLLHLHESQLAEENASLPPTCLTSAR